MKLLLLVYDCLFFLGLAIYIPLALRRKKVTPYSIKSRFGFIAGQAKKESIWIQVVSVGEVNVIARLVEYFKQNYDYEIVISTITLTGNRLAREKYGKLARVIFLPFDISFVVRRIIRLIKPKVFVAVETEVWPNLFFHLKRAAVPVLIINARISDKAFRRYRWIRPIMKRVLAYPSYVAVQNQDYKKKFMSLGCDETKIVVSGQMKFENIPIDNDRLKRCSQKYSLLLEGKNGLLLVAGSTHPGEEEILLGIYSALAAGNVDLRLVIAPRHIERSPAIEKIVQNFGFGPERLSNTRQPLNTPGTVFILDTLGELLYFYSIADICFVGGSFMPYGGHNILEPVYYSKPTLFGPHMDNFRDIEEAVLRHRAGIEVTSASQLETELRRLIDDSAYRALLSRNCQEVFKEERKSIDKHIELITQFLR
jgi:3-deoxy-D-manno-octulosonic-acid transferase